LEKEKGRNQFKRKNQKPNKQPPTPKKKNTTLQPQQTSNTPPTPPQQWSGIRSSSGKNEVGEKKEGSNSKKSSISRRVGRFAQGSVERGYGGYLEGKPRRGRQGSSGILERKTIIAEIWKQRKKKKGPFEEELTKA